MATKSKGIATTLFIFFSLTLLEIAGVYFALLTPIVSIALLSGGGVITPARAAYLAKKASKNTAGNDSKFKLYDFQMLPVLAYILLTISFLLALVFFLINSTIVLVGAVILVTLFTLVQLSFEWKKESATTNIKADYNEGQVGNIMVINSDDEEDNKLTSSELDVQVVESDDEEENKLGVQVVGNDDEEDNIPGVQVVGSDDEEGNYTILNGNYRVYSVHSD